MLTIDPTTFQKNPSVLIRKSLFLMYSLLSRSGPPTIRYCYVNASIDHNDQIKQPARLLLTQAVTSTEPVEDSAIQLSLRLKVYYLSPLGGDTLPYVAIENDVVVGPITLESIK